MKEIKKDISISIVNWNTKDLLKQCIDSIIKTKDGINVEIIVVDNNSSDNSAEMVKSMFNDVTLIANKENLGFAAANNQAIKVATSNYILLLNPDIIVLPDALKKMLEYIKKDDTIGAVGCKLLNKDASVQEKGFFRKFPTITQVFFFYTILQKVTTKIKPLSNMFWEFIDSKSGCEVDQTPGACTLVKREVIDRVGLMDEGYGLFFEDVDFCYRIKKAGYKLKYFADAKMIHYGMQSFNTWTGLDIHIRFNRSLIIFFKKHHGMFPAFIVYLIIIANEMFKNIVKLFVFPFYSIKKNKKRTIKESFYFLYSLGKELIA